MTPSSTSPPARPSNEGASNQVRTTENRITFQRRVVEFWIALANRQDLRVKNDFNKLSSTNGELRSINMAIAELSRLHASVTDGGDARKLRNELDKQPLLQMKVNNLLKLSNLETPVFDGEIRCLSLDAQNKTSAEISSFNYLINDATFLKSVGETALNNARSLEGVNVYYISRVPSIPSDIRVPLTPAQVNLLINSLTSQTIPNQTIPATVEVAEESGWAMQVPDRYITVDIVDQDAFSRTQPARPTRIPTPNYEGKLNWQISYTRVMYEEVENRNKYTLVGGLSTSANGLDLNKSVRRLQAEATNKSNVLQSNSMEASRSMSLMNSISEGFKSYIDKLSQNITQSISKI